MKGFDRRRSSGTKRKESRDGNSQTGELMQIAIGLYPGFTSLDGVGPYQVFCYLPGADVVLCAARRGILADEHGLLHFDVASTFDDVPARRARDPRWSDHPQDGPRRRSDHRVDPSCPPAHQVHDVGLHRRAAARRSGTARRAAAPPPMGVLRPAPPATVPPLPKTVSSKKAGSSPPRASLPASIWHSRWSRGWPATSSSSHSARHRVRPATSLQRRRPFKGTR